MVDDTHTCIFSSTECIQSCDYSSVNGNTTVPEPLQIVFTVYVVVKWLIGVHEMHYQVDPNSSI